MTFQMCHVFLEKRMMPGTFPDSYNKRERVPDSYKKREHVPDSYDFIHLFILFINYLSLNILFITLFIRLERRLERRVLIAHKFRKDIT